MLNSVFSFQFVVNIIKSQLHKPQSVQESHSGFFSIYKVEEKKCANGNAIWFSTGYGREEKKKQQKNLSEDGTEGLADLLRNSHSSVLLCSKFWSPWSKISENKKDFYSRKQQ